MEEQALLEAIRSDYRRLDRLLGISTEQPAPSLCPPAKAC